MKSFRLTVILFFFVVSASHAFEVNEAAMIEGIPEGVRDVAFSPDGKFLISESDWWDTNVTFWNVETMKTVKKFKPLQTTANYHFTFSPDRLCEKYVFHIHRQPFLLN